MYCTLHVTADSETRFQAHDSAAEAEAWARDALAEEGGHVEILATCRILWAEDLYPFDNESADLHNGVRRGLDYPATL